MTEKKRVLGSDLAKVDRHQIRDDEYEEAPELTEESLARGHFSKGGKPISDEEAKAAFAPALRRGRPPAKVRKEPINIRLSPEVLAHFRKKGPGWQTQIDETLKKVIGKKARKAVAIAKEARRKASSRKAAAKVPGRKRRA